MNITARSEYVLTLTSRSPVKVTGNHVTNEERRRNLKVYGSSDRQRPRIVEN